MNDDERMCRRIERIILFTVILMVASFAGCYSCARGQDLVLPTMYFSDAVPTNETAHMLKARQLVPPLPSAPPKVISIVHSTNDDQITTVVIRKKPDPLPLAKDKPRKVTNAFWVACPECAIRAIRTPVRMETNGSKSVPDGVVIDRSLYFKCCGQEFLARNSKFIETPIAEEVPAIPAK